MTNAKIFAVVPALNEDATITDIVTNLRRHVDGVVVVSDGSTDDTAALARDAGATVVEHGRTRGYDRAIDHGFARAISSGATVVFTFDADGQHSATDVPRVVGPILEGEADLVVGRRPHRARAAETIFALYARCRAGISDPLCGFKAYRADIYRDVGQFDEHSTIGTQLLFEAIKRGYTVTEVPITLAERADEPRFGQRIEANVKILGALFRLSWFDLTSKLGTSS